MDVSGKTLVASATAPGISVHLGDYYLSPNTPLESSGVNENHLLSFSCPASGDARSWGRLGAPGPFKPMGNLSYGPRSVEWRRNISGGGAGQVLDCIFDSETFDACTGLSGDWNVTNLEACLSLGSPLLLESMWRLYREMRDPGFATHILIEALGKTIAIEIGRHFKSLPATPIEPAKGCLAPWQMRLLCEHIEYNEAYHATVGELAGLCGISGDHLRRTFKNTTGRTLHAYVEDVKIEKAKSLLRQADVPLKEIAHRLGFANPSSFSVAFRRAVGETPKAYQRKCA